ncbi:MAG TPA: hypothetical protein VGK63_09175 [Candidatus Limnocylindrales bacterium]
MRRPLVALALAGFVLATLPAVGSVVDAGGCTKVIGPGHSITNALKNLRPGAVLCLRGGTYHQRVNAKVSGKAGHRIKVRAYHNERPIIEGLFWVTPRYVTFDGIDVKWDDQITDHSLQMVKFRGGRNWIWEHSRVWGARSYANVLVTRSSGGASPVNWTIRRSCIHDAIGYSGHDPTQDHNIYVADIAGSTGGRITRNIIFNATHGRNIKVGPAGSNVAITWNTLYRGGRGVIVSNASAHTTIAHNLIVRSTAGDLISGWELTGDDNLARDNGGWASDSGRFIGGSGIVRGGGNVWVNPHFSSTSCSGFRTTADYGRWAH